MCLHNAQEPRPGEHVCIQYNAAAGPLAYMAPLPAAPMLRWGFNSWAEPAEVIMERVKQPSDAPVGDWWKAGFTVPGHAAVLDFVVQYYEHYDNNDGANYKVCTGQQHKGCGHIGSQGGKLLSRAGERRVQDTEQG